MEPDGDVTDIANTFTGRARHTVDSRKPDAGCWFSEDISHVRALKGSDSRPGNLCSAADLQ